MEPTAKFGFSRRFILGITLLMVALIAVLGVSFHLIVNRCSSVLQTHLTTSSAGHLAQTSKSLLAAVPDRSSIDRFMQSIADNRLLHEGLVAASVFSKTGDEKYFRVAAIRAFDERHILTLKVNDQVAAPGDSTLLRDALIAPQIDPHVHVRGRTAWQTAYLPVVIMGRPHVVGFSFLAPDVYAAVSGFSDFAVAIRIAISILLVMVAVAVAVSGALFLHKFNALITALARSLKDAAAGNPPLMNPQADTELYELAHSFNSLAGEIAGLKRDPVQQQVHDGSDAQVSSPSGLDEAFRAGVASLKDNELDRAIGVFQALIAINPDSFGSYFNCGVALAKKRIYDEALAMFRAAQEKNPDNELVARYIDRVSRLHDSTNATEPDAIDAPKQE